MEETTQTSQIPIPQSEVDALLNKIKSCLYSFSINVDIVNHMRIEVIHPNDWEVSLLVPIKGVKATSVRKVIESVLFGKCGIEHMCCDYLGNQNHRDTLEWYFRHPNVPQDVYERIESEIEQDLGSEIGMELPTPSGYESKSDTAFITIKEEFYNLIASGQKTTEYRNLNQYYCDKFFPNGRQKRFLKINKGYKTGKDNQMIFEIDGITLVSDRGVEIPAVDEEGNLIVSYSKLPRRFAPEAYGIKLGKRIR